MINVLDRTTAYFLLQSIQNKKLPGLRPELLGGKFYSLMNSSTRNKNGKCIIYTLCIISPNLRKEYLNVTICKICAGVTKQYKFVLS